MSNRFNMPWFLLHKSTHWDINSMILSYELIEQLYLSGVQDMFSMFFILISCYSLLHHIPCFWWNTWFFHPIFIYYFLTSSPSLSLYSCLQITIQQESSSFTSICNRNFLCLCNVFWPTWLKMILGLGGGPGWWAGKG